MQSGPRPRIDFPACYKGYDLLRTHGRVFAIPPGLEWEKWSVERLARHPAVVAASSLEEIPSRPGSAGAFAVSAGIRGGNWRATTCCDCGANTSRCRNVSGQSIWISRTNAAEKGVLSAGSLEAIREQVEREEKAEPIEFAGWLPIFRRWGNCGQHPPIQSCQRSAAGVQIHLLPASGPPILDGEAGSSRGRAYGQGFRRYHRHGLAPFGSFSVRLQKGPSRLGFVFFERFGASFGIAGEPVPGSGLFCISSKHGTFNRSYC
ncbi:MAG: hypothetical protein KatS3mg105_1576 [Gemmatales bacterium]|nr:MAG: hypothetical protein KatS3mg105_1576 [Gemmatales bacterium]